MSSQPRHAVGFVTFSTLVGICLLMLLPTQQARADAPFRIGAASVDITPDGPARLTGYANRREEATHVEQPLHVRALVIEADDAPLSVLLTADVLGVPEWMTEELADRLGDLGVTREQLAICATHTHAAPVVNDVAPTLFAEPMPEDHQQRIDRFTEQLMDGLEEAARQAIENRQPGRLAWTQGSVDFAVNRRQLNEHDQWVNFGVVEDGPVDHDLPVLVAEDAEGEMLAVLLSYACHCTTLTGQHNFIHGDWAGEAAMRLEQAHDGLTALVAIGCGADANPHPRGELAHVLQHGQAVVDEVERLLGGELTSLDHAPRGGLRQVELPFEPISREELEARAEHSLWGRSAGPLLEELGDDPAPTHLPYTVQTWQFGDQLAMVFMPGEVVVDYARRLKAELDGGRLWVNAYANASPSYIPSARVIAEGGYEVDDSMAFYHQPNRFQPAVEGIIVDAVRDMLDEQYARDWPDAEPAELVGDNEPRVIEPAHDGSLRLIARFGTPYGERIEYMPEPEWEAFGWWRSNGYAAWEVEVEQAGEYMIYKEWSVADETARLPYLLEVGDERVRGYVGRTGGWDRFRREAIGRVTLEAGRVRVAFKPAAHFESPKALLDLREIRLVPVE